jgi:hypothetical protein
MGSPAPAMAMNIFMYEDMIRLRLEPLIDRPTPVHIVYER